MNEKGTGGLWRKSGIPGGKYLVQRRDGTVPDWPYFVIGARDEAADAALRAYADAAEKLGYDPKYVADVRELADDFMNFRVENGVGDPTARPHRKDDPAVVGQMKQGA
jgi:hypothetical protein